MLDLIGHLAHTPVSGVPERNREDGKERCRNQVMKSRGETKKPHEKMDFTVLAMENGPFIDGIYIYIWLVVSTYPSEKYKFVSWDNDISIHFQTKMEK